MDARSQTNRNRRAVPAIIYGIAAVILTVPVGLAFSEVQHMVGYGWPGRPYDVEVAGLNAGESWWKVQFVAVPSLLILAGAAVGAGFAARAAGQRVWLVTVVGLVVTVAVLAVAALVQFFGH